MRIRNSIAYHYYQPKKLAGLQEHFLESPRSEHNALAHEAPLAGIWRSRGSILPVQLRSARYNMRTDDMPIEEFSNAAAKSRGCADRGPYTIIERHIKLPGPNETFVDERSLLEHPDRTERQALT